MMLEKNNKSFNYTCNLNVMLKTNIYICITYNLHVLYIGLSPLPVIVEMKVYRDPLLKM